MDPQLQILQQLLFQSWSLGSSSKWTASNPAAGQCGVTALVVHDLLGGEIRKTPLPAGWHFYNWIDGQVHDYTKSEFSEPILYADIPASREEAFADTDDRQYQCLRGKLYSLWDRE